VFLQDIRMLIEQLDRLDEQVVEIERIRASKHLLIRPVDLGRFLLQQRGGDPFELVGADEPILRARYEMMDGSRAIILRADRKSIHQLPYDPLGVVCIVDTEIGCEPQMWRLDAQQPGESRVESAHPERPRILAHEALN